MRGTLQDVLAWWAGRHPERAHAVMIESGSAADSITYRSLKEGSEQFAAALQARGLEPGETVAIMLPTGRDYLQSFLGALLAGAVPVPIYPPARPSQLEDHLTRHAAILDRARARVMITVPEARSVSRLLHQRSGSLAHIILPHELRAANARLSHCPASPEDTAFLQFTSGSTGQPKGVILTHANLLANIRAMGCWAKACSDDIFVSWLPLYHDMGLIGAWLGSLYYGMLSVLMSPVAFLARPSRWLKTIDRYKATISAAPNFAYELCLSKVPDDQIEAVSLRSLRLLFNGAEPVSPHTLKRFQERFGPRGLSSTAIKPVYGLAEVALGLTFPPLDQAPRVDRIEREALERKGEAKATGDIDGSVEIVSCGAALPGYQVRVVDELDRELPDRSVGRLQFCGPSATQGYINNLRDTARLFHGQWLDSGDLAYISESDVFPTGRVKDVVIRAGRNVYPYDIEEAVGDIPGIRKGCVAVFGSMDSKSRLERLIVVAESPQPDAGAREDLRNRIRAVATDVAGVAPDEVILSPPRTLLKTSSGKLRRSACRESYERGDLCHGPRPVWSQLARFWLGGTGPWARRKVRALAGTAGAAYLWVVLALLMPVGIAVLLVTPSLSLRWRALRRVARGGLRLGGIPLDVHGVERIPAHEACVLVFQSRELRRRAHAAGRDPRTGRFRCQSRAPTEFVPALGAPSCRRGVR